MPLRATLATGAARLLLKPTASSQTVDSDTECGFDNKLDQIWEFVDTLARAGIHRRPGSVDWAVDHVSLAATRENRGRGLLCNLISIDGLPVSRYQDGNGTTESLGDALHPLNRRSAEFKFTQIDLNSFAAVEQKAGADDVGPHRLPLWD